MRVKRNSYDHSRKKKGLYKASGVCAYCGSVTPGTPYCSRCSKKYFNFDFAHSPPNKVVPTRKPTFDWGNYSETSSENAERVFRLFETSSERANRAAAQIEKYKNHYIDKSGQVRVKRESEHREPKKPSWYVEPSFYEDNVYNKPLDTKQQNDTNSNRSWRLESEHDERMKRLYKQWEERRNKQKI